MSTRQYLASAGQIAWRLATHLHPLENVKRLWAEYALIPLADAAPVLEGLSRA
jgi:hypothetical protein